LLLADLPSRAPFDEFRLETELPFARLPTFYGRIDLLQSIESILQPAAFQNGDCSRRKLIVLQGMGGIGKTQLALEYALRHEDDYSAVLWVDISDSSTVDASARRLLNQLVSHYAKREPGEPNYRSIAVGLDIPGQITREGQLTGTAAESPWQCVKRWMQRASNRGWCLVIDGINDETDEIVEHSAFLQPWTCDCHI
jgi:hypothetical protein